MNGAALGAKRKKPRPASEDGLHAAVAQILRIVLAGQPVPWTHFPAGGYRLTRAAQARLSRLGLAAGWPDLILLHKGSTFGIELKTQHGRVSPAQRMQHARLRGAGMEIAVCRSVDDVLAALTAWEIPMLSARIAA